MITASGLLRVAACPPSAHLPTTRSTNAYTSRGTAIHRFLARVKAIGRDAALAEMTDADWRRVAEELDVDALPVMLLAEAAYALDMIDGRANFLGCNLERDYSVADPARTICGTADIVGTAGDVVYIGDYFTGFQPTDKSLQLRLLAVAAARVYGCSSAVIETIYLREGADPYHQRETLDALDLDAAWIELKAIWSAAQKAKTDPGWTALLHEGEWCGRCPAFLACPAKQSLIRRMASGAEAEELERLKPMDARTAGLAWFRVKEARRMLERIESACMATLGQTGHLELPSGRHLVRVTEPGNQELDGRTVYAVVREQLGQEVAEAAVSIEASQASIERALAAEAQAGRIPPRGRAKVKKTLLAEVEARGGITRPMRNKIVEVDPAAEQLPAAAADAAEGEAA